MAGVEYQVTKVDPTDPETKGMVYQVNSVTEEVAATMGGKIYRARVIKDPTEPTVAGKVYQIVLIDDPEDPAVKGKVYNAILTGDSEVVVVGPAVSPLSLPDAIANSLSYVKAFGGTEQRNIPQPYTQVNYVTNTASTAVDTGIMIDFAKNYEFEVECRAVSGSWYILQSRASASGNVTGIHGETSGSNIKLVVGNVTVCTSAITRTVGNKLYVKATLNAGTATLYVKDETANTEDTQTGSYGTTQPNPTAAVYLLGNAGEQYVDVNSDIYMARIKENDTVVMDYVPARQVATAGFYDTVSGTFKTAETPANLSADGNTVPTPDAPMDIVSNNGVLKPRRQSGLPWGYTLLDYIEATDTQWINTGVKDNAVNYMRLKFETVSGSSGFMFSNASSQVGMKDNRYGTTTPGVYEIHQAVNDGKWQFTNETNGTTYTNGLQSTSNILYLFNLSGVPGTSYINKNVKVYYYKASLNGVDVLDLLPARRESDGVLGMYNLVNGQFYTNAGTGDFVAGTAVSDPVEIYTDGTVETIWAHGKNLFDVANADIVDGTYIDDDGNIQSLTNAVYTDAYTPVKPNTTYTWSGKDGGAAINYAICEYDADKTFIKRHSRHTSLDNDTWTTEANTYFLRFNLKKSDTRTTLLLEQGSTATDYQPYYNGGTATAEMLLKVDNYQDEQEILSGAVTRNVGVKVLDGTEGWSNISSSRLQMHFPIAKAGVSNPIYCTHFVYSRTSLSGDTIRVSDAGYLVVNKDSSTSAAEFKQFLADQYNAGTPVIVIYPLATPTTESVTGQTLQVTSGDNVLEITQASLSGLELEAEYMKEGA